MDFEKCWNTLVERARAKGMDITTPGAKVEFTAENLKALLEQFHAQGEKYGRSRESYLRSAHSTVDSLFDSIFGGRR